MQPYTTDTFFNGRLRVKQPRSGYRYSIDSVLLSSFITPDPYDVILDMGTGCGIIPLILAYRYANIKIYGIDIQPELAKVAALNVNENHTEDRVTVLCRDLIELKKTDISDLVNIIVCNPPYRKVTSGRINRNKQKAVARHELQATLTDILEAARRILDVSGRFVTIYPADRAAEVITQMHAAGIEPKLLQMVHSYQNSDATLLMVEGIQGGRPGITIRPPLIIYASEGRYTAEVEAMFE